MGTKSQLTLKVFRIPNSLQNNFLRVIPSCHESDFENIANSKSSKEVWDILGKAYKGDNDEGLFCFLLRLLNMV